MPSYELTYILRPLDDAALVTVNERVNTMIASTGGEIVARNDWGKRRFAYPIKKLNEGFYSSLQLNLPTTAVRTIERALQLNDDVLRYLVVRVEEHPTAPVTEAQKETT
ncbi:MAG: 30S ribosomal protein S6 [Anaerolineae bacterium]